MDLRQFNPGIALTWKAKSVLNYQPFIITDHVQTGVGYSFCYCKDPREAPPLVFNRKEWSDEEWKTISESNRGLAAMYDDQIQAIAKLYPGHSLLDVACNNGYFPVAAELAGMNGCAGFDAGRYALSMDTLNRITGARAKFYHGIYDPSGHTCRTLIDAHGKPLQFDVVCASAILCHLSDPQYFLKFLADHARKAVFFWGQVLDSDQFVISYNRPHRALSKFKDFPHNFNDNTRISYGLFKAAMGWMGFSRILEFRRQNSWIKVPEGPGGSLEEEIKFGSSHKSLLFLKDGYPLIESKTEFNDPKKYHLHENEYFTSKDNHVSRRKFFLKAFKRVFSD